MSPGLLNLTEYVNSVTLSIGLATGAIVGVTVLLLEGTTFSKCISHVLLAIPVVPFIVKLELR